MSGDGNQMESLDRTVVRSGDAEVTVTLQDVKAIQTALLEHLKGSDDEDRDDLIRWANGPAWIDSAGSARIGPWLLGSDDGGLYVRYREPPGALAGKAHKAYLAERDGAWSIRSLLTERIRVRR